MHRQKGPDIWAWGHINLCLSGSLCVRGVSHYVYLAKDGPASAPEVCSLDALPWPPLPLGEGGGVFPLGGGGATRRYPRAPSALVGGASDRPAPPLSGCAHPGGGGALGAVRVPPGGGGPAVGGYGCPPLDALSLLDSPGAVPTPARSLGPWAVLSGRPRGCWGWGMGPWAAPPSPCGSVVGGYGCPPSALRARSSLPLCVARSFPLRRAGPGGGGVPRHVLERQYTVGGGGVPPPGPPPPPP